ncbi:hypothetical protein MMU07_01485 [Aquiflexum sp. LQ15W]|uniref:hypothetical protein n=1 Tax=Cognataquiflexum nitidum TaxID=2922272 RepID=UPI001F143002|nr:hypothetical protein [Cognataquiflexum nitidum]MCH6198236.1 hypothetical protein [Cognataquiflexum nitidum]
MRLETINKELECIFSTVEFEENGEIHITGADWYSDDLRIEFVIKTGIEGQSQLWEAQISGVREDLIKSDFADKLELFEEHPLLWTYNQRQTNLYFGRPTERPYELFVNIYNIHLQVTRNRIPFDKFLNNTLATIEICKSTMGLFAKGPIKIMEAYKEELERHNMNPSIVGGHNPKRWLDGHQVDETEIVKVLVMGDSYVVGETFDFQRV